MKRMLIVMLALMYNYSLSQDGSLNVIINDGTSRTYAVNDIVNLRITKNSDDKGIIIYYRDSLKKGYTFQKVNKMNFSNDFLKNSHLNVYYSSNQKVFSLPEVDSIKIEKYQDPAFIGVEMCEKYWMPMNLDVSHYSNGDAIPEAKTDLEWMDANQKKIGAWCYMYNNGEYGEIYGKLYNWYAVNDPRGLAPEGWHVPSADEWSELIDCIGGFNNGGYLKEIGSQQKKTGKWFEPNAGATDKYEFTALPGGWRYYSIGEFAFPGYYGVWWSSTSMSDVSTYFWILRYDNGTISRESNSKGCGFSVRCVLD